MSQQQRRISVVIGLLFLIVFAWSFQGSLEVIRTDLASPMGVALVVSGVAMALGGLAFVIGGLVGRTTVGEITLEWWQFQSVGFVCIGLYMAVSGLAQMTPPSLLGVMMFVAGIGFLAFGVYRLRAGAPTNDVETSA
ncbi:hypothetical protein AB7C87_06280 [Natrarchaeobius sp. A-rgal3]|uniref:hypothetical protein n=1 Tax=Natrarchaeobius versutus TaxID=1679078 RepID=UPI00350F6B61